MIEDAKLLKSEHNLECLTELFKLELQNRQIKRKNAYIKFPKFVLNKENFILSEFVYCEKQ